MESQLVKGTMIGEWIGLSRDLTAKLINIMHVKLIPCGKLVRLTLKRLLKAMLEHIASRITQTIHITFVSGSANRGKRRRMK